MTWSSEKTHQLVKLYNEGYPASFIASWLDVEPARVRRRLDELGLVKASRPTRSGRPVLPSLHALYRRASTSWSSRAR